MISRRLPTGRETMMPGLCTRVMTGTLEEPTDHCGKDAVAHILIDPDCESVFCCGPHLVEYRARWDYWSFHKPEAPCGRKGSMMHWAAHGSPDNPTSVESWCYFDEDHPLYETSTVEDPVNQGVAAGAQP